MYWLHKWGERLSHGSCSQVHTVCSFPRCSRKEKGGDFLKDPEEMQILKIPKKSNNKTNNPTFMN